MMNDINGILCKDVTVNLPGFSLQNINIDIPKGVVVGLIGKNGAGKTTLIQTLANVYTPDQGKISIHGRNVSEDPEEFQKKIAVVYDKYIYPEHLKAYKIAEIVESFYPDFDMDRWRSLMERFELDYKKAPHIYSKGMQIKFMLSLALARNPEVLILDEPTAGMDPAARLEILELIQEFMLDENHTVIFSTHITTDLDKIADYIVLISNGRVAMCGEKEELLDTYRFITESKDRRPTVEELLLYGSQN